MTYPSDKSFFYCKFKISCYNITSKGDNMKLQDLKKEYIDKYGKVTNTNYSEEELTNIVALHIIIFKYYDSIDHRSLNWEFYPSDSRETCYFFKNPDEIWESYIPDTHNNIYNRNTYNNSHECLKEVLDNAIINNKEEIFECFEKYSKIEFNKEFLEEYREKVLIFNDNTKEKMAMEDISTLWDFVNSKIKTYKKKN